VHAAREVLAVVEQELAAIAEAHRRRLVELGIAGVVHAAVDDHARAVHALGDPIRGIRDVLGDEGLDLDAADVLFPGIDTKTVQLLRRLQVEEVPHEHLALGAAQVDLLAEGQAAAQRPAPQHLRIGVRNVEVGAELAAVARGQDARHVQAERLVVVLGLFFDEGRFVPALQGQLFRAADVVGVGMRDEQVLDVVHRAPEFRQLQRRLGTEIDEQRRLALDDDDVGLEHLRREGRADAQEDDAQVTVGGQRELAVVLPDADARGEEFGLVFTQIELNALEHDSFLQKAPTPQRCTPASAVSSDVTRGDNCLIDKI